MWFFKKKIEPLPQPLATEIHAAKEVYVDMEDFYKFVDNEIKEFRAANLYIQGYYNYYNHRSHIQEYVAYSKKRFDQVHIFTTPSGHIGGSL